MSIGYIKGNIYEKLRSDRRKCDKIAAHVRDAHDFGKSVTAVLQYSGYLGGGKVCGCGRAGGGRLFLRIDDIFKFIVDWSVHGKRRCFFLLYGEERQGKGAGLRADGLCDDRRVGGGAYGVLPGIAAPDPQTASHAHRTLSNDKGLSGGCLLGNFLYLLI